MSDLRANTEAIRSALHSARQEIEAMRVEGQGHAPQLRVSDTGQGFAEQGQRLASSLSKVHASMLQRLDNRLTHFDALHSLASEISEQDHNTAEGLGAHELR
ncbi:hypothetical protein [Corynebacterium lubricantis]|uniref:hypothetical protein n=1 Tax=Corynebacterium lubricantis TaxID=541095 RepID=UPI0003617428|nr:hypothetical protein [Corynebacterium lubricantis]